MNKNIFCLITIIVIILLIDLVFNISKPLFRVSEGFDNHTSMKSLVNILDGTTVSIEQIDDTNKYYIPIFDKEDRVLGLDKNNELVISDKIQENAWTLLKYNHDENNQDTFLKEAVGDIITDPAKLNVFIKLDLYLLTNTDKTYAIQYIRNSLVCTKINVAINMFIAGANLWNFVEKEGPTKELILRDIKQSYLGPVKYSGAIDDPNNINIKLNLEDERLKQLLNLNNSSAPTNPASNAEQCDTYLSRDAVKSLCPGCV